MKENKQDIKSTLKMKEVSKEPQETRVGPLPNGIPHRRPLSGIYNAAYYLLIAIYIYTWKFIEAVTVNNIMEIETLEKTIGEDPRVPVSL